MQLGLSRAKINQSIITLDGTKQSQYVYNLQAELVGQLAVIADVRGNTGQ